MPAPEIENPRCRDKDTTDFAILSPEEHFLHHFAPQPEDGMQGETHLPELLVELRLSLEEEPAGASHFF